MLVRSCAIGTVFIDEDNELRVEDNRPSRCSSIRRSTPTP
jgi:hypothetical protein